MKATFEDFQTKRHITTLLSHTKPEMIAGVNTLIHGVLENYKPAGIKIIYKLIGHVIASPDDELPFWKVHIENIKIVVYSDGSFSNVNDGSSHLSYQIFITDKSNSANSIDFASVKSKIALLSEL